MRSSKKFLKSCFARRSKRDAIAKAPHFYKKGIDVIELGPGPDAKELKGFLEKPGRRMQGIDLAIKEKTVHKRSSTLYLRHGEFFQTLKAYPNESVKHFRMKMVLSYQGDPKQVVQRYKKIFRQVFEKLVPRGRFLISEQKEHINAVRPALEEIGFKITVCRKANENEITSFWQKVYAKGRAHYPWVLVAVKPKKQR